MSESWLSYLNLSDSYERRARFLPAVLSLLILIPLTPALGVPILGWVNTLLGGSGIAAILAVGLSHIASAFGNRLQRQLWSRWPHDSPTNRWLAPDDKSRSTQQKHQWYDAIKNMTGLDIQSAVSTTDSTDLEPLINDAVTQLRNLLWKSAFTERLNIHNSDYGFARNLTGLRPVWVSFSVLSVVACWIRFYITRQDLLWPITSTVLMLIAILLAYLILPAYVRQRAHHYAETFFSAVLDMDRHK